MSAERQLLRTQVFRWVLYPLLALLILDALLSYGIAFGFARHAYDRSLVDIARELSLQLRRDMDGRLFLDLPEAARRVLLEDAEDVLSYQVTDREDHLISGEAIAMPTQLPDHALRTEMYYDATLHNDKVRVVQVNIPDMDGAIIRVAETTHKRDDMGSYILAIVVLPQVLLIMLAGILVSMGVTIGLRPLDRLQRAIAMRSHRDRSLLAEDDVPGEVQPLVVSINALLSRLDNVLTLQSRFIADAAHQLKTPVAGLKAQVELLIRSQDQADIKGISATLYIGVERLSRLVSQLLSLARNEPDAVRAMSFAPLDLNALVLDASSNWVPLALRRRIDLGFEASDGAVMIMGDAGRLRELVDNLLDNAIRYSQQGGRVTVRVIAGDSPTVAVSDDGPSIPKEERRRIFERFHRLLGSGDGSGLGLAIAQEIAVLHNATITLADDDQDGIGNVFSVIFPPLPEERV